MGKKKKNFNVGVSEKEQSSLMNYWDDFFYASSQGEKTQLQSSEESNEDCYDPMREIMSAVGMESSEEDDPRYCVSGDTLRGMMSAHARLNRLDVIPGGSAPVYDNTKSIYFDNRTGQMVNKDELVSSGRDTEALLRDLSESYGSNNSNDEKTAIINHNKEIDESDRVLEDHKNEELRTEYYGNDDSYDEEPIMINASSHASNDESKIFSDSIVISKNQFNTYFISDRERTITIDANELVVSESHSKLVPSTQMDKLFFFILINMRPDAIFTEEEFQSEVLDKYAYIYPEFIFVKDKTYVFAYKIGDETDTWDNVISEMKESNKIYDFCNTVAKKCASKHFRMNHSQGYIKDWMTAADEDEDVLNDANKTYYLYALKSDPLNELIEDSEDGDEKGIQVLDYWKFYGDFKDQYFAQTPDVVEETTDTETSDINNEVAVSVAPSVCYDNVDPESDVEDVDSDDGLVIEGDDAEFDSEVMNYGTDKGINTNLGNKLNSMVVEVHR